MIKNKKYVLIILVFLIIGIIFISGCIQREGEKSDCPYECCANKEYKSRACPAGYECQENKCVVVTEATGPGPTAELARIGASYTSTPPLFDGVLGAHGEDWGDTVITKTLGYTNSLTGESETHEMNVYARHDDNNLYIAITVENDDFFKGTAQDSSYEDVDYISIFFDGNNDGVIEENEDMRRWPWDLPCGDFHFTGDGTWIQDTLSNGGGRWRFVSISGALGDYIYEFEIPLNSGDAQDLSITPGSTVGIKIEYQEMHYFEENGIRSAVGGDAWPSKGGVLDGLTYGKLTLGVN